MSLKMQKQSNILVGIYIDNSSKLQLFNKCVYNLQKQDKNVDVVFMHHNLNDEELSALKNAVKEPTISLIVDDPENEGEKKLQTFKGGEVNHEFVKLDINSFADSFNSLFQMAVDNGYEFMSIVESEDEISSKWYGTASDYAEEKEDVGIFLPIIKNMIGESFTSYINEFCWAEKMAETPGYYDITLLTRYNCIHPLGALIRVSSILAEEDSIEIIDGKYYPMKSGFKITHYYEFFLRMVYNDVQIFTIPRVGYQLRHTTADVFDTNSSKIPSHIQQLKPENGGMNQVELKAWSKAAVDDYIFEDNDLERLELNETQI